MSNSIQRSGAGSSDGNAMPTPARAGPGPMDQHAILFSAGGLLAVLVAFWLLGSFMGMAALIVPATLFFVWREPGVSNPLRWEDHYEQPDRAE
ncbi:hypothetical protein PMI14_07183 [Acidovorax sp. CF316]|uniref:hypothetical protein n=1 Tax=Acidovorax sp. CF316 TaxID=1144317 RepID=UPI00026BCC68|nr:hypothetical protein [Acidovorax sp. CF316]EJE48396.1 hypothetical protein PMI14_07183 [Acidovorax sp. CF316]